METPFHKDYLEYCESNVTEIMKIWQEEKEPMVWKYNRVPLFDFTQLFGMLEKCGFMHLDFTNLDKVCLDVSDKTGDIRSAEATSKEECILKILLEMRKKE